MLLEDADFESLYVDAMDGLEDDPALQATINLDVVPVGDRFAPSTPIASSTRTHGLNLAESSGYTTSAADSSGLRTDSAP
jgi:hypothetical protein